MERRLTSIMPSRDLASAMSCFSKSAFTEFIAEAALMFKKMNRKKKCC